MASYLACFVPVCPQRNLNFWIIVHCKMRNELHRSAWTSCSRYRHIICCFNELCHLSGGAGAASLLALFQVHEIMHDAVNLVPKYHNINLSNNLVHNAQGCFYTSRVDPMHDSYCFPSPPQAFPFIPTSSSEYTLCLSTSHESQSDTSSKSGLWECHHKSGRRIQEPDLAHGIYLLVP